MPAPIIRKIPLSVNKINQTHTINIQGNGLDSLFTNIFEKDPNTGEYLHLETSGISSNNT